MVAHDKRIEVLEARAGLSDSEWPKAIVGVCPIPVRYSDIDANHPANAIDDLTLLEWLETGVAEVHPTYILYHGGRRALSSKEWEERYRPRPPCTEKEKPH